MSSSHNLPRRRPANPSIDTLSESMKSISLQKGSTFQVSPKQESEVLDPFLRGLSIPNLPNRSVTCPKALEDLLIGAGERRAVELLKRVDDAIAKNAQLSSILSEPEVLPVPRFMVENASFPDSSLSQSQRTRNQQDKDSGVGSSIDSAAEKMKHMPNNNTRTAVNRSIAGSEDTEKVHCLSDFAQRQINHHIVQPILRQESLKEFHPLIRDVPNKIGSKDIRTLRDLEKTLIFLAPDFSKSPSAYRSFCETSIRCLHLAVNSVHESDRCLPTDRPYSTNYFIDLVEQIRRYASILAATREKQIKGEPLDENDALPTDEIELQGGMTHNGKPGFLTRRRGSQHINMADDQRMSAEAVAAASVKRAMDDLSDDDSVRRSMARRKKNEPIKTYYCKHEDCTKSFKRPCDLTKHIKTHERPWKCPEESCKYHEVGWPTEKERERHVNDKHSDAPNMYKCLEPGCPYTSKRESNCKQHMEKAHNIPYVRSKNNGKGKAVVQRIPKVSPSMRSDSAVGTPFTPPAPSPSVHSSTSGDSAIAGPSNVIPNSTFDFADFSSHFNVDYLNPASSVPITPSWSADRRTSVGTSATNYSPFEMPGNNFDDVMMKSEPFDFTMYDNQGYQQPTPESLNNVNMFPDLNMQPQQQYTASADLQTFSPHVSPGAQDVTFGHHFTDAMAMDDAYGDDFSLYNNTLAQNTANVDNEMFGGLDNMGSQFAPVSDSQHDILSLFPELQGNH
ncbi:Transcription factor IIIA [Elsinoe australis]|uniref:Transcription factor IIIA n=1 Tax=Elsinoe australis TaxID=40998 RepID=A0A2P8A5Q5_9PEZI|nr:Transcription factor IIIA [Elsinoe australis]